MTNATTLQRYPDVKELTTRYDEADGEIPDDQDVHIGTLEAPSRQRRGCPSRRFRRGREVLSHHPSSFNPIRRWRFRTEVSPDGKTLHTYFSTTTTIPNDAVKLVNSAASNEEHGGSDALLQPYYHQRLRLGEQSSR